MAPLVTTELPFSQDQVQRELQPQGPALLSCGFLQLTVLCAAHRLLSSDPKAPARPQWALPGVQTCSSHGPNTHAQPLLSKVQILGAEECVPHTWFTQTSPSQALLCPRLEPRSLTWTPSFLKMILF